MRPELEPNFQDYHNRRADKSLSNFDVRHWH